ncbi:inactive peptidyl-prolyl cis-trans isomerase shutdown-like [Danaus plexippus]|uniref:inactive peptidyl-prolyl cis-trans isomerase shutdown-like n=1 Tax=Danaus plexippus TaxID=13037 RepID=UPI002AB08BF0|nr:inactive peptidyl-prolyl cis-trans isomerase shutdown-like [Danaus plexippus]
MEEVFKDPVPFSKGVRLQDLINGESEFHIDLDFKKTQMGLMGACDDDLFPDMEENDNDTDDMKLLEDSMEAVVLSCPEYRSFDDLASKMIDCVPSGDVKMLIIEEGSGCLIPPDAVVTVHYAAYFEKARIPFDSTLTMNNGLPLKMQLGKGRFIPGLEIGLTCVHGPKAHFQLMLSPRVAWGERGALPRIRPDRALFVIQLYDVTDVSAPARFNDLPMEEQRRFQVTMETVKSIHSQAKELYSKKKYLKAIRNYQQSVSILNISNTRDEEEENNVKDLKIKAYINLAVCYYKLNKPKYVLNMCESLDYLTDTDKHSKILFYYARAHEMLNKYDQAVTYYRKALKIEPHNKEIGDALTNLDKYNKKSAVTEKEIWRNVFKTDVDKKVRYSVDRDFQNGVLDMCQELAGKVEYSRFDLPSGLTKDELECIKDLCSKFEGLVVMETGEGKKKNVSIVKRLSS